jgi:large repetitive protein
MIQLPARLRAAWLCLSSFALLVAAQTSFAHGVQIGYGILANGFVRVYVEHWHGDNPGLSNSPLDITISSASGTTTSVYNAMGQVNNTAWNNLPGLGANIHILATCPGEANTYNDWLYWDFAPGTCNQPVSITINSGTTVVTTEACSNLYPQTITGQVFTDQGAPVITANNVTVVGDCTGAIVNYTATAVDDCDPSPSISYSQASGTFFPVGTTVVTVTSTDNTGKTSVKTFNVTVVAGDSVAPSLTVPAAITVDADPGVCGAVVNFSASATDNCSTPTVVSTPASGSFFAVGTTTVTTVATDAANNKTTKTFTVTVRDTQAPTLATPGAITVNAVAGKCSAPVSYAATASDNCSGASVSYSIAPGSIFNVGTTLVTATATDAAGNTTSGTFNVTVVDNQAPTIGTPAANATVECDGAGNTAALSAWLANHGGAVATDNCGAVTWSNNFTALSQACGHTGAATVVFTATDASGNTATTAATFTVVDTTAPTLTAPAANKVFECDAAGNSAALHAWLANNGGATATDACGAVTWSNNFTALTSGPGATGAATVTFVASDACGNTVTTTATFSIVDTTPPAITTAAANKTVECDGAGNTAALSAWLAANGGAVASDACGTVTWSNNFTALSQGCGHTGSATVTFVVTDQAGNTSSTTASFSIVDTTAPTITAAANKTVECDGAGNTAALSAWLANNGGATATDVCSTVKWSNNFTAVTAGCGATATTTVTFVATDECGNTSSSTATFSIVDTTAPTLSSDVHDILPSAAPITFTVSAQDVCGTATATITSVTAQAVNGAGKVIDKSGSAVIQINGNKLTIVDSGGVGTYFTVNASAVDACGNTSSATYVIHVLRPANEGVGNGVDGDTPGAAHNGGNDQPGTSPGNPGAKGKKS